MLDHYAQKILVINLPFNGKLRIIILVYKGLIYSPWSVLQRILTFRGHDSLCTFNTGYRQTWYSFLSFIMYSCQYWEWHLVLLTCLFGCLINAWTDNCGCFFVIVYTVTYSRQVIYYTCTIRMLWLSVNHLLCHKPQLFSLILVPMSTWPSPSCWWSSVSFTATSWPSSALFQLSYAPVR